MGAEAALSNHPTLQLTFCKLLLCLVGRVVLGIHCPWLFMTLHLHMRRILASS